MINIFRSSYDLEINFFHGKEFVNRNEVVIKHKDDYTYVEPEQPGRYAFGGTLLFTSNRVFPEFNTPIKLHDRQMDLEVGLLK